jgi:hypothetical protein
MAETLIVVVLVVTLVLGGTAALLLSWHTIALAGVACVAAGALLGVPAGVYYHVKLHRVLAPRGILSERWWVSPATIATSRAPSALRYCVGSTPEAQAFC